MDSTFADRMNICIERVGDSQTKLAEIVSEIRGEKVSPQAIQALASRNGKNKPAQGSTMCASIATAAGVRAQWLEYGEEPMIDPFASLDRPTYALLLAAAAKLAAPTLDPGVRSTALGVLQIVANQPVASYAAELSPTAQAAQKKESSG